MPPSLPLLRADIEHELAKRDELAEVFAMIRDKLDLPAPEVSVYDRGAIGSLLRSFYNGCENVFRRIAAFFENDSGARSWHPDLRLPPFSRASMPWTKAAKLEPTAEQESATPARVAPRSSSPRSTDRVARTIGWPRIVTGLGQHRDALICELYARPTTAPAMLAASTHSAIDAIPREDWNRLVDADAPFLRHEFLAAMERHGCVGEALGWIPQHLALRDATGRLVAAAPLYLKHNSYGELVFDWAWADAYRRSGERYYPKLVVASPYTPANGPRLLTASGPQRDEHRTALIQAALGLAERLGVSSLHWLFTTEEETSLLARLGHLRRLGCQFHWQNRGYRGLDDLLASFSAEKRKKIKRERRRVAEAGIRFEHRLGQEASDAEWAAFHRLYRATFDKRGGIPTLSRPFFREIAATMGEHLLLVLAYRGPRLVAAAFDLIGTRTLYGRHWGCCEDHHSLHFETCYYQGLEYCLANGLERFEPGAQGEHKVSRGFLPTATWSAHWIADPRFRRAIAHHLELETQAMQDYLVEMQAHSPYKAIAGRPEAS